MDESVLAPRTACALLRDGRVQMIDVRGRDEVELGRIPGVRSIPLAELPSELVTLDRRRPVVFVSDTGRKAVAAMKVLRAAGITASSVEGGVRAWRRARLPIEDSVVHAPPPPK
jgi:rhodanese-related sulfurtransferase